MNAEKWQKVKMLFAAAVELSSEEQTEFLEQNCDDAEIISEVKKLIASDKQAQTYGASVVAFDEDFSADEQIGNYKIIRKIGEGGMGVVYEALRQNADFEQIVALKLLKRGMDSEAMLRRFRNERQILATLTHPNIARLLDGGMTQDNLPFFAMEYVEGLPIDVYCKNNNLDINERLRLFTKVCAAVSFAHSRLVVHRDLKPSNILVTADGEPKLLDFGIAKILSEKTNIESTVTKFGMMTPRYASPEQARGEIVATSSDIYSLGLVLYELLTENPAYHFSNNSADEIAKVICHFNPPKPSEAVTYGAKLTNLKTDNLSSETVDQKLKTKNQKNITQQLRGDLDNIVLKSLRKEPENRYASVEQFASDIKRHLEGLPVTARPITFSYRLEKFVVRHRVPVFAGALIIIWVLVGLVGISWQYVRAESERQLAQKRFGEVRQIANNVIFKYYDAIADVQGATKAREMMVSDATQYLDNLAAESGANDDALRLELAQAYLRIGQVQGGGDLANVGKSQSAAENYRKAIPILEDLNRKKPNDLQTVIQLVEAHKLLAVLLLRTNSAEAKEHLQTAVGLAENLAESDPANTRPQILLANAYITSARALPKSTEPSGGVEVITKAISILQKLIDSDPNSEPVLNQMWLAQNQLGVQYGIIADGIDAKLETEKKHETAGKAAAHFHRAAEISEKLLASFPASSVYQRDWSRAKANESSALSASGKTDEALKLQSEILQAAIKRADSDPENMDAQLHVYTIKSQTAETYEAAERFAEARVQFAENRILIDKLIEKDGNNGELQRKKYELLNHLGDCYKDQTSIAVETYNAAYKYAQTASTTKNTPFVFYAEGLLHQSFGDAIFAQGEKLKKRAAFTAAKTEYEKALSILENPSYAADKFGYSSEMLRTLKLKIEDCSKRESSAV